MKIMVFTEGTIIMHKNATGHSREEIVKQVLNKDTSLYDFSSYIPINNAAKKLMIWIENGAKILYLTSRRKTDEVEQVKNVLKKHGFPDGKLLFRKEGEGYKIIIERIKPDIYIDDDCESIGGNDIDKKLDPELKVKVIIIKEFGGIDDLSDDLNKLS